MPKMEQKTWKYFDKLKNCHNWQLELIKLAWKPTKYVKYWEIEKIMVAMSWLCYKCLTAIFNVLSLKKLFKLNAGLNLKLVKVTQDMIAKQFKKYPNEKHNLWDAQ